MQVIIVGPETDEIKQPYPWGRFASGLGYSGGYYLLPPGIEKKRLDEMLSKLPEIDLLVAEEGYPQPGWVRVRETRGDRNVYRIQPPKRKYCWATLVMRGDGYVPGAVALATSLRRVKSRYPLVCMVTDDVSSRAKIYLRSKGIQVTEVPLLSKKMVPYATQHQQMLYGKWSELSVTKWNVLNPQLFPYDKVMFLDSDMIVVKNMDDLLDLPAPAATFSSPWNKPYSKEGHESLLLQRRRERGQEGDYATGDLVPLEDIKASLETFGGVLFGSLALLSPGEVIWRKFLEILSREGAYGHPKSLSGPDEQVLSDLFIELKLIPRHIHQADNFIPWKPEWLPDKQLPRALHYCGTKPWDCTRDSYNGGFDRWWEVALIESSEEELRSWGVKGVKPAKMLA